MGKTMACIKDGVVINLLWVDNSHNETEELKDTHGLHIRIGDIYSNGSYYRDNIKVLSYRDQLRKNINDYDIALTEIAMIVNAPMTIAEGITPSIEERKQAILMAINSINQAIEMMKEGGL